MYILPMTATINKLAASAKIGKRIAHYRRRAGMTQSQMAKQLGITQPLLACYETGKRNIPVALLEPCAELLQGNVSMFFDSAGQTSPPRKPGPPSKLDRQVDQLRRLPPKQQQLVSDLIDTVLKTAEPASTPPSA